MRFCTPTLPRFVLASTALLLALAATVPAWANTDDLVLSAPPRGKLEEEKKTFDPVAAYLSKATGRKIVYKHIDNWLSYQSEMQKGKIDIVFDGPHFASWRMYALKHEPVAKLPGKLGFVAVVKTDNKEINDVNDLAGHRVCAFAPPNLATLTFLAEFDNPARQPRIVNVESFGQAYKMMLAGKCQAAVLRDSMYKKAEGDTKKSRIIFQSPGIANQTFTIGPRMTLEERTKAAQALTSPEAQVAMKEFLGRYSQGKSLQPATQEDYRRHARLLKDSWGFELKTTDAEPPKPAKGKKK